MAQLQTWLFEVAWFIPAIIVLAGLGLTLFAMTREDKTLKRLGLVIAGLAVVWCVLTVTIQTSREQALARTAALVEAYDEGDWERFDSLLDPQTRFDETLMLVGEEITAAARRTRETIQHESVSITDEVASQDTVGIQVSIEVVSLQQGFIPRLKTAWRFHYVERGEDWYLERITILPTDQFDPAQIRSRVVVSRTVPPGSEPTRSVGP